MNQITNDEQFKQALHALDDTQQRVIAARFVEHVLPLAKDDRLSRVVEIAADDNASDAQIGEALQSAKAATFDSHTRCGAEGNWTEQAGYFVARAAVAAVSPAVQTRKNPAWQAAMSSRMAQTSLLIDNDSDDITTHSESEWQYDILSNYLNS